MTYRMMHRMVLVLVLVALVGVAGASDAGTDTATSEANQQQQQGDDHERFHPDKGVLNMKATVSPSDMNAYGGHAPFSTISRESDSVYPEATTSTGRDESDDDSTNTLNDTTTSTPSYDENNTVEVSISLAIPLTWNLTSSEDQQAVDALVEDVSTAATQLFHDTLDHAITMLDGSPSQTSAPQDSIAKDAQDPAHVVHNQEKPNNQRHPTPDHNQTQINTTSSEAQHAAPGPPNGGANHTQTNQTDLHGNFSALAAALLEDEQQTQHLEKENPKENPSETLLWDWLGVGSLSKEELYKMVLEYLDIEDEDDWHNASVTSPLLRNLKAEIRQAIYGFFFHQQRQHNPPYNRDPEGNHSTYYYTNASTYPNGTDHEPTTGTGNHSDWSPLDQHYFPNDDETTNHNPNSFYAVSGLWEMFLADTRVELVLVQDTYAWWQLTMIYPVYVHYQAAAYNHQDDLQDELDETLWGINASVIADGLDGGSEPSSEAAAATETKPYWVPVTDQGTLDFISRLLQRVLEAAVLSGAFLSSLQSLQDSQQHLFFADTATNDDIVGEILALTIPGMEHPLDELISPYDEEMEDMETMEAPRGVDTDAPLQPPWGSGTFTYGLLEESDRRRRQQVGILLLLVTCVGASGMVVLAAWRNVTNKKAMEKAWLLGTDKDVAELLQVGWRQYDVPNGSGSSSSNNNNKNDKDPAAATAQVTVAQLVVDDTQVQRAEIIEVYDKSREGYFDNDSMLHGSAMQQSYLYDGSEVPSAPMEYEKHLERHKGRGEKNMFSAIVDT